MGSTDVRVRPECVSGGKGPSFAPLTCARRLAQINSALELNLQPWRVLNSSWQHDHCPSTVALGGEGLGN